MNRRSFLASLSATLPLAAADLAQAQMSGDLAAGDLTTFAGGISSEPMLARYRLTRDRVMHGDAPAYTPEFLMEDILATGKRRFTNFSGDVSGRWIGALSSVSRAYRDTFPALEDVVAQVTAQQHPDGYFGKIFRYENQNDDDMALLWGNGRLLVGLTEYYALKPDPKVLNAAKKLGDFLIRIGPDFNTQRKADEFGAAHYGSSYICWTQQTEGLAALYALTRDARYRDLCIEISTHIERRPSDHVHGYLCSVRGTVDLYETTGDPALLKKAVAEWNSVMGSGDVLVTGGVPERWSPLKKRTEGCAECDWLRMNLSLYRATGDLVYLETAERTLFNEFAMNQFSTGDFGHAVLNEAGTPVGVTTRAWWCCTLHGMRAFADVCLSVFRSKGNDIFYDLPVDGHAQRADFEITARSKLATDGTIEIRVTKASGQTLMIRKPLWADALSLSRNGHGVAGLHVEQMKAGDTILVKYGMSQRRANAGASTLLAGREILSYGPWLLGVSMDGNLGYFCEQQHLYANKLLDGTSTDKPAKEQFVSAFAVPIASASYRYIPAEFPDQPSQVHLRAVSEQTAILPTTWETTFLLGKKDPEADVTG